MAHTIDPMYTEGEQSMPEAVDDQRTQVCGVQGHLFTDEIQTMVDNPDIYIDRIPDKALCHRCGLEITLADII